MVISELLASLGLKDEFSGPLDKTLQKGNASVSKWKGATAKQFALAGTAVVGFIGLALTGIHKFTKSLLQNEAEVKKLSKELGISKDQAAATKSALDAMGKSMEEIKLDPALLTQFNELKAQAEKFKPPDLSEGLETVKSLGTEFAKVKQTVTLGLQWVGHYFLKYVQRPLENIRNSLKGLNSGLQKSIPKISESIGKVMAWIVRLGTRVIQGASKIWQVVTKLLDMVPGKIKLIGGAMFALNKIIRAGPLGIFITLITAALLLLDDFYTYLEGGESLLAPLWKKLIEIWNLLKDDGTIEKLKKTFTSAMNAVESAITKAKNTVLGLLRKLKEHGAINNFKEAFQKTGTAISKVFTAAKDIVNVLMSATGDAVSVVEPFLVWLISDAIPSAIGLISDIAGGISGVISWVTKLDGFKEVILTIAGAIGVWKVAQIALSIAQKAAVAVQEIQNLLMVASALKTGGLAAAQTALAGAEGGATIAQWALNAAMSANPIALIIIGVAALIAIVILLVKNWDKVKEFFIKLWVKIKETFSGIAEWFGQKFTEAKEAVIAAFRNIGAWFGEKASQIISFFVSIPGKLGDLFSKAVQLIKDVFTSLPGWVIDVGKNIIKSMWDGIISMGSWLKDKVAGFFTGIWEGVKGIFGGGDNPDSSPEPSGGSPSPAPAGVPAKTPGHADGGIFDKEHVAPFAEGNKAEAIIPLTKPKRAAEIMGSVNKIMGTSSSGDVSILAPILEKAVSILSSIGLGVEKLASMNPNSQLAGLENMFKNFSNLKVVSSTPQSNSSIINNNQQYKLDSKITVNDKSGNSKSTGTMVDKNQRGLIRNLQSMNV